MQKRITHRLPLLNNYGILDNPGYATKLLWDYDKSLISHSKFKIKEWDYYYIGNDKYAICLTIADNGYFGAVSVSLINFLNLKQHTKTTLIPFPLGKLNLPKSSEIGISKFENKNVKIKFINDGYIRKIKCIYKNFYKGLALTVEIDLKETYKDSLVIATPFKDPSYFYYNQKINGLSPKGYATLGNTTYTFDNSFYGLLDWGRGVWTYKNTWYWASFSDKQNDDYIGLNLGYGFGNNEFATENAFFLNGKLYKLDDVKFFIPSLNNKKDFLDTWIIKDSKGLIDLKFVPILKRYSNTNLLLVQSKQNQVFGYFSGTIKIDDKTFNIDKAFGFAEEVFNRW